MITKGMKSRFLMVKNYIDNHQFTYTSYESLDDYPKSKDGKAHYTGKRGVIGFIAWRVVPTDQADVFIVADKSNASERYALSTLKNLGIKEDAVFRILLLGTSDGIDMFGDVTVVVTRNDRSLAEKFEQMMQDTDVYSFYKE